MDVTDTTPTGPDGWCHITGVNGRTLRTSSYHTSPAGASFVTALGPDGHVLAHVDFAAWTDTAGARHTLKTVFGSVAGDDATVDDDSYGPEISWQLPAGEVRTCPEGTYVRLLDVDGNGLDGGSAYWTDQEFADDPELVMGAVLGAAASLAD